MGVNNMGRMEIGRQLLEPAIGQCRFRFVRSLVVDNLAIVDFDRVLDFLRAGLAGDIEILGDMATQPGLAVARLTLCSGSPHAGVARLEDLDPDVLLAGNCGIHPPWTIPLLGTRAAAVVCTRAVLVEGFELEFVDYRPVLDCFFELTP